MLRKIFLMIGIGLFTLSMSVAQDYEYFSTDLRWNQSHLTTVDGELVKIPWSNHLVLKDNEVFPAFSKTFPLTTDRSIQSVSVESRNIRWKVLEIPPAWKGRSLPSPDQWTASVARRDDKKYIDIEGFPYKNLTDSTVTVATQIEWKLSTTFPTAGNKRTITFEEESVLRTGSFIKIRIPETGVYKLDKTFFEEVADIDISDITPSSIQLFTGEAGMLPEAIADERIDDLEEIPLLFSGSGNNFSENDQFLFYSKGPSPWKIKPGYNWSKPMNAYDQYQYLFLRTDGAAGKRIQTTNSPSSADFTTSNYLDHDRYEIDEVNLLGEYISGEGSGQNWYGDNFSNTRQKDYTDEFQWDRIVQDSNIVVKANFAGRLPHGRTGQVIMDINGSSFSKNINGVELDEPLDTYANKAKFSETFAATNETLNLSLSYPSIGEPSKGWLDFIQVEGYRELYWNDKAMHFSHPRSASASTVRFEMKNAPGSLNFFDVTDPMNPRKIEAQFEGNTASITYETGQIMHLFHAFESPKSVEWAESIDNQNIHRLENAEMLIVYHPSFEEQALRLRDHRIAQSGMEVRIISTEDIYNEFSSGKVDPSAIRNFAKMMYDRSQNLQYLLLFGDASYDFRGLDEELSYENFVPTFETHRSLSPISSFPTDDYFALLSNSDGNNLKGGLDIAVGRLPIASKEEGENLVDKIIRYETNSSTYGPWRLKLGYSADDGDDNRHFYQANDIATNAAAKYPVFNNKKFYIDAYPRNTTPGGVRFPQANQAINEAVFQGMLVFNYLGHGGPFGLTQERVLTINDISNWNNKNKLPLFITATCTFSPYDDPGVNSGGERVLHNTEGGGIGLYTTVRAVYSGSNKRLNDAVYDRLFKRYGGEIGTLGETMMNAKNANDADTTRENARKFALLGDPSLKLAVPKHQIAVNEINGSTDLYPFEDTLSALDEVTVKGEVQDRDSNLLSGFSGQVHATVFDKAQTKKTLGQSGDSQVKNFKVQNNVLFKGNASVENGRFSFTFVIPQDIDYEPGQGKISLYAYNGQASDASGHFDQFIIGGASDSLSDNKPPVVQVFMNTTDFESGGVTNQTPTLLAIIDDDRGINITGNSIGHDMVAELSGPQEEKYVLNDYFESDLNDYSRGDVRFPLGPLEEGAYSVEVRAYDIANNVGKGSTEFIVVNDENKLIDYIRNYPNPFGRETTFEIGHNFPPGPLEAKIEIFNNLGQRVSTLEYNLNSEGFLIKSEPWDGVSDRGGGELSDGVYFYRVILSRDGEDSASFQKVSETKKLIISKY